jgi:hypothetical protein
MGGRIAQVSIGFENTTEVYESLAEPGFAPSGIDASTFATCFVATPLRTPPTMKNRNIHKASAG